jgi:predicted small lipoprotein YifL
MRRTMRLPIRLLATVVAIALAGCGPKGKTEAPRGEREADPARGDGPPEKIMPEELKERVDQVFAGQKADLERCYTNFVTLSGQAKLKGTIIVAVKIGWRANPSKVWFLKNTYNQEGLTRCFVEKIKQWEFPTWGGLMDYAFPPITIEPL